MFLSTLLKCRVVREIGTIVFVDVGAAGSVEQPWDALVGSEIGKVVGFEPHPDNFAAIKRYPTGEYHQMAIATTTGTQDFYLWRTLSSLTDRSAELGKTMERIQVSTDSLENLRDKGVIPSLDIVKTDVERHDFEAVASAGPYIHSEVLAIQSEFSMLGDEREAGLHDFICLLRDQYLLAEISLKRSSLGEIRGGDCLFLRRPTPSLSREMLLKLMVISAAINNTRLAEAVLDCLKPHLGTDDLAEISRACAYRYLPDMIPRTRLGMKLSTLFGLMSHLAAGNLWSEKSTFSDNRLRRVPLLMVRRCRPGGDSSHTTKP